MISRRDNSKSRCGAEVPEGLPSPEFVNSLTLINKFCPLTKREGNRAPFTSHPSRFIRQKSAIRIFGRAGFALAHTAPRRKFAFTLAEVLITLGIIGVVAAMTLPTLVQRHREKQTVSALKSAYSIFSQAYLMAVKEYGTLDNWGFAGIEKVEHEDGSVDYVSEENGVSNKVIYDKFAKYLKVGKHCSPGDETCLKTVTKGTFESGILTNGMAFNFVQRSGDCSSKAGSTKNLQSVCADITVDIDGPSKGENAWGKDWFRFYITKYGVLPKGTPDSTSFTFSKNCINASQATYGGKYGEACTAWVLYNENMDYLHCDDLSWEGKTKCK